jgi:hypothetical protein
MRRDRRDARSTDTWLQEVVAGELPRDATLATSLVRDLLRRGDFGRSFALRIFTLARDSHASHELRCLASLAFEHQFRLATTGPATELLHAIGASENGEHVRGRITRNEPVHLHLGDGTDGLRAFLRHTRRECRLFFARYAFTPAEVVATIRARTRSTPATARTGNADEAARTMNLLPPYEREIVRLLIEANVVYWVDSSTPSTLNALVEYPAGTVVLVIKPPGSDLEIEIKRAGVPGQHALDVRYRDDRGAIVPIHHHLWGGSRGDYLRAEEASTTLLAHIHRLALGTEAPIPRIVKTSRIESLPAADGTSTPLPSHFGDPLRRERLQACLERIDHPAPRTPRRSPAARFLEATTPSQAILIGTTSFRLERLRAYLVDGIEFDGDADELLDEIIDDYVPPPPAPRTHEAHIAAALALNRAAADRAYVSILAQVGRFWGTVLGMRGGSGGESFVVRNAGLRKVWSGDRWQVRFIAMDHDSMGLAGSKNTHYNAPRDVLAFVLDLSHILGGSVGGRHFVPGEIGALKAIYRVSSATASTGFAAFRSELCDAYARTLRTMATDPRIRQLMPVEFLHNIREWDRAVIDFVRNARDEESQRRWQRRTRARLRRRGLPPRTAAEYAETVVAFKDVLPWFVRMYEGAK